MDQVRADSRRRNLRLVRLAILLASTAFTPVWAQDLTWSPTAPNSGGNGTWNTGSAVWFNGTTLQTWNNAAIDNAIFGGAAGTVTLGEPITAHNLTFSTSGYVVQGNTLTLGGANPTVTVNTGQTATISSVVAGSSGLIKSGTGTLIVSNGTNTYMGGTTVSQGTLVFGGNNALGSGTITLGDANTGASNVSLLASFPNFASGRFIQNDIVVNGAGTGTVSIGTTSFNPGSNGTIYAGTLTLNGDVTFVGGSTDRTSFNGKITGTGNITITGNRVTIFNSANDFVGSVTITSGSVLQLDRAYVLPATTTLNILGNGQLRFTNTSHLTIDGLNGSAVAAMSLITGAPPMLTVGAANGSGAYAGVIGNVISSFTKLGTGTQILSGANTYVGVTTISGGILSTPLLANGGVASGIGRSTNAAANLVFDGGTLQYTGTGASTDRQFTLTTNGGGFDASGSGALNLTGTAAVTLSGAGARTLTLTGSSTAANTLNAPLGDNGGSSSLIKSGAGTWVLTGANTYSGQTWIQSGILALSGNSTIANSSRVIADGVLDVTGLTAASASVQRLAGSGSVLLGAKNLTIANANDTFSGAISGTGNVTIAAGVETFSGPNNYSGTTTVNNAATLRAGATNTFSAASAHTVLAGGTLDLAGFSQTIASLDNAGTVNLGGAPGATLTLAGNYVGSGGMLMLNTALGGDSAATDRLVVQGSTTGSTTVRVINVGGAGAPTTEGIKIVDVGGASNGTFTLQGDYVIQGQQAVVGGAYAYTLQKNGVSTPADGDWYLRSSLANPPSSDPAAPPAQPAGPLYQPGVPLYESYGQILLGMNGLSTFRQRVGDRYSGAGDVAAPSSVQAPSPIWARVEGQHTKMTPSTTTGSTYTADQMKLQSGFDGLAFTNHLGQLIFGVSAHYTTLTSDIKSFYGNGKINVEGAGLGASLTWFGDNGFYVDGQSQVTWYKSDLSSDLAGTVAGNKLGYGYAVGAEGGQRVPIGGNFSLTPQAQLTYSSVNFDSFTDRFGAVVSNDRARSLLGRAGLSLDHQRVAQDNDGRVARSDIYGIANLYYEFLNGTAVDVSGTKFASATDRLWGGVGVGGNYRWAGDKYAVYGEVSFNTSLADAGDNYAYKGTVGFRAKW